MSHRLVTPETDPQTDTLMSTISRKYMDGLDPKAQSLFGYEERDGDIASMIEHVLVDALLMPASRASDLDDGKGMGSEDGHQAFLRDITNLAYDRLSQHERAGVVASGDEWTQWLIDVTFERWIRYRHPALYEAMSVAIAEVGCGEVATQLEAEIAKIVVGGRQTQRDDLWQVPGPVLLAATRLRERRQVETVLRSHTSGERVQLNLRLTAKGRELTTRVAGWYGVSQAALVEMLVRQHAAQIGASTSALGTPEVP